MSQRLDPSTTDRVERLAGPAFFAFETGALVWLIALGRTQWFNTDEWDFLANRTAFSLHDLFRPHNEHLSTLPILAFRLLWSLVGLRSYVPYLALLVLLHLTAAALLRAVMRRAGVCEWVSTLTASILVLFGAGTFNIEFAFQIGFVGALDFGLVNLLVTDHDGPINRRDFLGLGLGLAAVLSSGVGVVMAVVVALSVLLRRGWRAALVHAAAPAALYVTWFALIGRTGYRQHVASVHEAVSFITTNVRTIFDSIGRVPGTNIALAAIFVVGLCLAWNRLGTERARTQLNAVSALVVGSIAFLVMTAIGRGHLPPSVGIFTVRADEPQIVYIVAALLLAPLAVAAAEIARRSLWLAPLVLALLVIGIPGNARQLADTTHKGEVLDQAIRHSMLSIAQLPVARQLPRSLRPSPIFAPDVSLGWLLDGVDSGKIPSVPRPTATEGATLTLNLVLQPAPTTRMPTRCLPLGTHRTMHIAANQPLGIRDGAAAVTYVAPDGAHSTPVTFDSRFLSGTELVLLALLPVTLDVAAATRTGNRVVICSR